MATPTVGWWEVILPDKAGADKARKFYGDVFGWEVGAADPQFDYSQISSKEAGIGGGIGPGPSGKAYVTFYVTVDDPDAYLKKVERAGGRTAMPTTPITPDTTIAQFTDPSGNLIGLLKASPPPAPRKPARATAAKRRTTTKRKTTAKKRTAGRSTTHARRAR